MNPEPVAPLLGMTVETAGRSRPALIAAWLLAGMGAGYDGQSPWVHSPVESSRGMPSQVLLHDDGRSSDPALAVLRRSDVEPADPGVAPGTWDYCAGVALACAALASWRSARPFEVSQLAVAIQIHLPEVMAAAYSAPPPPLPPRPRPAPAGGWVQADLGAPGDEADYALLLSTLEPGTDSEALAATAQLWRLPVCEYRSRPGKSGNQPSHPISMSARGESTARGPLADVPPADGPLADVPLADVPLADVTVCDMSVMWAGPLCTWLGRTLGASVVKIEPSFRPDGTRALRGGGIYPGGRQRLPGQDSGLWNALNHGKQHVDLDLRVPEQRDAFLEIARTSDVLVESFSPRVVDNLAIREALSKCGGARAARLSMPAFPPGPRRQWVSYGTGVHAVIGLGDAGDGQFLAPTVSYPDPVAGFTGALALLCKVVGRDRGRGAELSETSLYSASLPLLALGVPGTTLGPTGKPGVGRRLLDAGRSSGEFVTREVAGLELDHPRGPIRPLEPDA